MEIQNDLKEKVKVRKKYVTSLVIIGMLIALLVALSTFLCLKLRNPRSIYFGIIDYISNDVIELLEDVSKEDDKPKSYTSDISFNMESNNNDFNEVAKLINKINLRLGLEIDKNNRKDYMDISLLYKNENVLNANFFMNDTGVYGKLRDLYDKTIKFVGLEDTETNETDYLNNYIIVIDELRNIIKASLKKDYFVFSSEKIHYLGKKTSASKSTLELNKENLTEIINNIIKNINESDKLLKSISEILGLTKEELIAEINNYKNELKFDDTKYVIDIYQKKLEIIKVVFSIDEEKLIINKEDETTFKASIVSEGVTNDFATIINEEDKFNIIFNIEEKDYKLVMELKTNDEECYLKIESNSSLLELKMNLIADGLIDGFIRLKDNMEDTSIRLDITLESKNIEKVNEIDVINYINIDDINDNDYELIAQKLLQNTGVMSLVQDILAIEFISSLITL